jgi:hypothetical protein
MFWHYTKNLSSIDIYCSLIFADVQASSIPTGISTFQASASDLSCLKSIHSATILGIV